MIKRCLSLFVILLLLSGCAGMFEQYKKKEINVVFSSPRPGEERTVEPGDIFFEYYMLKGIYHDPSFVTGENMRFVLKVIDVDEEVLRLVYQEYRKPVVPKRRFRLPSRGFRLDDPWHAVGNERPAYYYIKSFRNRIIRFKDYEFRIIKAERGRVTYKRLK